MNLNIAICDDNKIFCDSLKNYLNLHFPQFINCINKYHSGIELINDISNYSMDFDLIFLDIDMPKMNGIKTAEKLREFTNHSFSYIIFITSYDVYASEVIKLHPFAYLKKPIDYNNLDNIITEITDLLSSNDNMVMFSGKKRHLTLDTRMIKYIKNENRNCLFHIKNEICPFKISLSDVEAVLADYNNFIRVHSSYILNIKYLKSIYSDHIILLDNTYIPIGRKYKDNLLNKYAEQKITSTF